MADFDLLVVGDANPDLVLLGGGLELAFGQGERVVDRAVLTIGGSAAIMACGAARLGLRTSFVGVVGDDVFGRFMLDALAERGVDVGGCAVDPGRPTGVSVVFSRGEDRATLTSVGTTDALRAEMIDRDLLRSARHLHSSLYFMSGISPDLPALFAQAREAGLTTSLDPQIDPAGRWNGALRTLLPSVDCFLPNEEEACAIGGDPEVDTAAAAIAKTCPVVAVKLGAGGGLAVAANEIERAPAPSVAVIDSTGAGDSFDAGFVTARLMGWALAKSLRFAVACGSLATRAVGGTETQPTMDEALASMEGAA